MVKNDGWAPYVRQPDDGPADHGDSWWTWLSCWSWFGSTWVEDTCMDNTRFVGEYCWDGSWYSGNPGQCKSDDSYTEYAVSCYDNQCTTWAEVNNMDRPQCSCGVSGG